MTIHLCRDYLTQNVSTGNRTYIYGYLLSIFLRRVLGYSYVGDTNFNINSAGPLLIATGDSTPTSPTATFLSGTKAGINIGSQKEFYVTIPSSVRTVSGVDIGRILVLKSNANPRFNSGLFVILGIETSSNSYIIDYRTLGDYPPVEVADTINWYLYEKDISCPLQGGTNTKPSGEYRSDGNSNTPRVILQSPHITGWQVRICNEGTGDVCVNLGTNNCVTTSVSPGFGGTSAGDFPIFGQHFHAPMWYNSNNAVYIGGAPGLGDGFGSQSTQFRVTIVGDDTGQGLVMYCRRPGNATQPTSNILCFGLVENEPSPLPINNHARLFVLGTGLTGNDGFGNREVNDGSILVNSGGWSPNAVGSTGMSSSPFGTPVVACASFWAYVSGGAQGTSPIFDSSATDNPYTSTTELLPIDVVQATLASWGGQVAQIYPFAPKPMGTIPHLRAGRSNFGDFSPTTDSVRSYQHLRRGLFIPWNGPNLIP